jgi:nucleotide-binding universal stress UspA family protein
VEQVQSFRPIVIRRILCAIDFSNVSRDALGHAVAIAKWYRSSIAALHVISSAQLLPPIAPAEIVVEAPTSDRRRSLTEELQGWLELGDRAGVKTEALIDAGGPARCILDQASSLEADLIVMGTHGLAGFERFILGSVAEKVLRKAACPVLTVPPAGESPARVPYTRLLCPVDFSESSLEALRFAFSLAQEADAHLTILHVFDWPPEDDLLFQRFDVPAFRAAVEEEARKRLDGLVTDDVRVWCQPETKVSYGKPYREILATAENDATDLIVMGIRGRNSLETTLFGSTTNHVVRSAHCPVLTLKPQV